MRKIILFIGAVVMANMAMAQNVTNSPYSQYGIGELANQSNGANQGMNGMGLGWREHNQVNFQNPASYSGIDSLSFIFDAALSAHVTNFTEGDHKLNANNSSFDYVVAGFRVAKHVGVSFGVMPYSNIGYSYYNTTTMPSNNTSSTSSTTYTNTYTGTGGLHQAYIGVGVEPVKGLSVGANFGYLWGSYEKSVVNSYSDSYVNTLSKYYTGEVRSYKLDLGAQYDLKLSKTDKVTLGLVYGTGHKLHSDPTCSIISTNSQTSVADTTELEIKNGLSIPVTYGGGIVYNHANKYRVGFDYKVQKWGNIDFPVYSVQNNTPQYSLASGQLMDSQKFTLGGEYCANENGRGFMQRIRYRFGASYATPYIKINGVDGPKEYSVSAGLGIPIVNGYNSRSILNVSAQWVNRSGDNLIKENTFRLTIGLTFNERWFAKWKVE